MANDLDAVFPNYRERHEAGESYEDMAAALEGGRAPDARMAAFLRQRAAGDDPGAVTDPPAERSAGQKAVTVQEAADAQTAATPEEVAAELAAEGGGQ